MTPFSVLSHQQPYKVFGSAASSLLHSVSTDRPLLVFMRVACTRGQNKANKIKNKTNKKKKHVWKGGCRRDIEWGGWGKKEVKERKKERKRT